MSSTVKICAVMTLWDYYGVKFIGNCKLVVFDCNISSFTPVYSLLTFDFLNLNTKLTNIKFCINRGMV